MVASNNHASCDRSNILIAITNARFPCLIIRYHMRIASRSMYPLIVYGNEVISMKFIV